jgi:hypothetical protein
VSFNAELDHRPVRLYTHMAIEKQPHHMQRWLSKMYRVGHLREGVGERHCCRDTEQSKSSLLLSRKRGVVLDSRLL